MPPIRYINLDRDAERRDRMQAELERQGLQGERFSGVLWSGLPEEQKRALYSDALNSRQFHKPLVNGEKGCYASHLAVWQWLLNSPYTMVIVLEDDVRLLDRFPTACQAIEAWTESWDMIKLIGRSSMGKHEKVDRRIPLGHGIDLVRYRRVPSLTAGYVLNRRGAEKLLQSRIPFGRPIDVDLRHWWECKKLEILGVDPGVIGLDDTSQDSSIGAKSQELSVRTKWLKFRNRFSYTLNNAWHR